MVAEGVETRSEFDYLRERGCDVIQGYYICRPLPPDAFLTWLTGSAEQLANVAAAPSA